MQKRFIRLNTVAVNETEEVTMEELQALGQISITNSIPVYGERLSFFIAGPPGCGKSTTTAQILSFFPDQVKYLFTDITEDDRAFEGIKFRKVKMETDILESITLDKLTKDGDCWCVFDDVDKIRDPKKSKVLLSLMDNILANGRKHGKHNINIVITSHSLSDYKRTKYAIENCNYWVFFPDKTMLLQIKTLLKKDGLEKLDFRGNERIFYHRSFPHFLINDFMLALI